MQLLHAACTVYSAHTALNEVGKEANSLRAISKMRSFKHSLAFRPHFCSSSQQIYVEGKIKGNQRNYLPKTNIMVTAESAKSEPFIAHHTNF